eukprot:35850-Eustigmatos_ZCMA.PRE.1
MARLTFGMNRPFRLLHKATQNEYVIELEHGSLFLMWGSFNTEYMHCVPPLKGRSDIPRLNLTYRVVKEVPQLLRNIRQKKVSQYFIKTKVAVDGM